MSISDGENIDEQSWRIIPIVLKWGRQPHGQSLKVLQKILTYCNMTRTTGSDKQLWKETSIESGSLFTKEYALIAFQKCGWYSTTEYFRIQVKYCKNTRNKMSSEQKNITIRFSKLYPKILQNSGACLSPQNEQMTLYTSVYNITKYPKHFELHDYPHANIVSITTSKANEKLKSL